MTTRCGCTPTVCGACANRACAQARLEDGTVVPLALERYVGPADETDERILRTVRGPVLDVGCGPGRHLHALARRGMFALGVDLSLGSGPSIRTRVMRRADRA